MNLETVGSHHVSFVNRKITLLSFWYIFILMVVSRNVNFVHCGSFALSCVNFPLLLRYFGSFVVIYNDLYLVSFSWCALWYLSLYTPVRTSKSH